MSTVPLCSLVFHDYVSLLVHMFNFQGPSSKNPLSYKWYNAEEEILGKKMKVGFHLYSKLSFLFHQHPLDFYLNSFYVTAGLVQI